MKSSPLNAVEQWGVFATEVRGPSSGNPFVDVSLGARFALGHRTVDVAGFYDGDGVYRVLFSPDTVGLWTFETTSSVHELNGLTGSFQCIPASSGNRGPVSTANKFHFQYADETPYFPFGTTCYAYGFVGSPLDKTTLEELRRAGFNKVRMCLLPKPLGDRKPVGMPFEQSDSNGRSRFDFTRPNPAYFRHVEERILDLQVAGIQADLILFHPYDAWGFKEMGEEADDRYLRYAVARFSAYRNVWWSIANEYDLIESKKMTDWDRFFRIVAEKDPYGRLRSIHHSKVIYDHSRPWCTHASLQEFDFEKTPGRLAAWNKPVIYDEIQYEGNISRRWGNLAPQEMTRRFWLAIVYGAYATHGETYQSKDGLPVWSDAGKLQGSSAPRLAFLRKILEESGTTGLMAADAPYYPNASNSGQRYLYYFDYHCAGEYEFPLPEEGKFKASLIDPWEMTKTQLSGAFSGKSKIELTGKPYMAVLFEKI